MGNDGLNVKKCNSDIGSGGKVVVLSSSEFGGVFVEPIGVDPVGVELSGVEPAGVEPVGVEPLGVEPLGVEPLGVEPLGVEPVGVEPVGVIAMEVVDEDVIAVVPVRVVKVVNKVDIVVDTLSVESIESPLFPSPSSSLPPGISTTHKTMINTNKSIKITTRMIIFLCLLSFTE